MNFKDDYSSSFVSLIFFSSLVNFGTDEYHSATAKTVEKAKQLIEAKKSRKFSEKKKIISS